MTEISTTRKEFKPGQRRGPVAQLRLQDAYKHVFKNLGKDANTDLVLADLAEFSGFYNTAPYDVTANQLFMMEGQRQLFSRIISLLGVTDEDRRKLQAAAADELQTTSEEGFR